MWDFGQRQKQQYSSRAAAPRYRGNAESESRWSLVARKGANHYATYYNPEYPEISVAGGPGENETRKWYRDGRVIIVALLSKITIPGHGVVVHETGRVIFDSSTWEVLVQSGPGDVTGDTTAQVSAHATC